MNIDREQTSFNIANEIKKSGYTLDQLSEKTGISKTTISKWVNGDNIPSLANLITFSNTLNIKLDNLISFNE